MINGPEHVFVVRIVVKRPYCLDKFSPARDSRVGDSTSAARGGICICINVYCNRSESIITGEKENHMPIVPVTYHGYSRHNLSRLDWVCILTKVQLRNCYY